MIFTRLLKIDWLETYSICHDVTPDGKHTCTLKEKGCRNQCFRKSRYKRNVWSIKEEKNKNTKNYCNTVVSNSIKISRNFNLLYIRNGFQIRIPRPKYACAKNFKFQRDYF